MNTTLTLKERFFLLMMFFKRPFRFTSIYDGPRCIRKNCLKRDKKVEALMKKTLILGIKNDELPEESKSKDLQLKYREDKLVTCGGYVFLIGKEKDKHRVNCFGVLKDIGQSLPNYNMEEEIVKLTAMKVPRSCRNIIMDAIEKHYDNKTNAERNKIRERAVSHFLETSGL